jgi:nucleotide-binding universal stress UspA family protein
MNKIFVALDGSPRAEGVLASAVSLARLGGGKLVLFRSFGLPAAMPASVWALPDGSLLDALRNDARAYLEKIAKGVPAELAPRTRIDVGVAWQAICDAARDENADVIVIGSHGYSGIDHFLGTTAAKVVNHADRPVLVVRPLPKPKA